MKRFLGVLFAICFLISVSGCSKSKPEDDYAINNVNAVESQEPSPEVSSNSVSSGQDATVSDTVIAVIGGKKVYKQDFEAWLQAKGKNLEELSKEEKQQGLGEFLQNLILATIARERGLDKDPEVRRAIEIGTDSILRAKLLTQELPSFTEEEIGQMYDDFFTALDMADDSNNFRFQDYKFYQYASVFFPYINMWTLEPQERDVYEIAVDNKEQAQNILSEFWGNGADVQAFRMLARQYSLLENASRGGKHHYTSDEINQKITEANEAKDEKTAEDWKKVGEVVFGSLKKNDPSPILHLFGKYYIFFSNKEIKGGRKHRRWEDLPKKVKENIVTLFRQGVTFSKVNELIEDYRKREEITVYDDRL